MQAPHLKKPKATLVVKDSKKPETSITFQVTPAKLVGAKQVLTHSENLQIKNLKSKKVTTARTIESASFVAPVKLTVPITKQLTNASKHVNIARKSHADIHKLSANSKTCKRTIHTSSNKHKNNDPSLL